MKARELGTLKTAKAVTGVIVAAALYLALRVYDDFATTGTIEVGKWIAQVFPRAPYQSVSMLLDMPFVLVNSAAVALVLPVFFRRRLWVYGLAAGVISEAAWILVWRAYIWGRSSSELTGDLSLRRSGMFVLALPLAASWTEGVFRAWVRSTDSPTPPACSPASPAALT